MLLYISMGELKKHWRLVAVLGFALFYLLFWLTAQSVIEGGIEIGDDGREEKKVEDVRDVDVDLVIESGFGQTFSAKLTSNETVGDLLEKLRSDGQLSYEHLEYTYGTQIISINGQEAGLGGQWNVYDDSTKINDFTRYKLSDDAVYYVRIDPI